MEQALNAALASVDAIYAIEHVNAYHADVASPAVAQEFWEKHGELPGLPLAPEPYKPEPFDNRVGRAWASGVSVEPRATLESERYPDTAGRVPELL